MAPDESPHQASANRRHATYHPGVGRERPARDLPCQPPNNNHHPPPGRATGNGDPKVWLIQLEKMGFTEDNINTPMFQMTIFKVVDCDVSDRHDWVACPFAHSKEKARRRNPHTVHYLPTPCSEFKPGKCRKGDECNLAHGPWEQFLHMVQYRTVECVDKDVCPRRPCWFYHNDSEKRSQVMIQADVVAVGGLMGPNNELSFDVPSLPLPLPRTETDGNNVPSHTQPSPSRLLVPHSGNCRGQALSKGGYRGALLGQHRQDFPGASMAAGPEWQLRFDRGPNDSAVHQGGQMSDAAQYFAQGPDDFDSPDGFSPTVRNSQPGYFPRAQASWNHLGVANVWYPPPAGRQAQQRVMQQIEQGQPQHPQRQQNLQYQQERRYLQQYHYHQQERYEQQYQRQQWYEQENQQQQQQASFPYFRQDAQTAPHPAYGGPLHWNTAPRFGVSNAPMGASASFPPVWNNGAPSASGHFAGSSNGMLAGGVSSAWYGWAEAPPTCTPAGERTTVPSFAAPPSGAPHSRLLVEASPPSMGLNEWMTPVPSSVITRDWMAGYPDSYPQGVALPPSSMSNEWKAVPMRHAEANESTLGASRAARQDLPVNCFVSAAANEGTAASEGAAPNEGTEADEWMAPKEQTTSNEPKASNECTPSASRPAAPSRWLSPPSTARLGPLISFPSLSAASTMDDLSPLPRHPLEQPGELRLLSPDAISRYLQLDAESRPCEGAPARQAKTARQEAEGVGLEEEKMIVLNEPKNWKIQRQTPHQPRVEQHSMEVEAEQEELSATKQHEEALQSYLQQQEALLGSRSFCWGAGWSPSLSWTPPFSQPQTSQQRQPPQFSGNCRPHALATSSAGVRDAGTAGPSEVRVPPPDNSDPESFGSARADFMRRLHAKVIHRPTKVAVSSPRATSLCATNLQTNSGAVGGQGPENGSAEVFGALQIERFDDRPECLASVIGKVLIDSTDVDTTVALEIGDKLAVTCSSLGPF
eukprot:TRINITY_DN17909_c0_g1_i3.p1 TRINITY_DN17909_c0_g1~~TRINITY_DN17909_c0_g1_i3.p1  ORF type:complete len:982 (+),score=126.84 TRINITY_DN17909_c0_g1_i3:325-3270(+)